MSVLNIFFTVLFFLFSAVAVCVHPFEEFFFKGAKENNAKMMKIAIGNGVSIKAKRGHWGWTALHVAARFGSLKAAEALLKGSLNVDISDNGKWTALHVAAFCGQEKMAQYLLEKGANTLLLTKQKKTASQLAHEQGYEELAELIETHKKT